MDEIQNPAAPPPPKGKEQTAAANGKVSFWRCRPVILIGTVLLAALFFFGLQYLAESFTHETTDDAFLDADIVSVAPKVAGQVKQVPVTDNQAVKAGDLLVEIDPRDLQVQLDQKRAALKAAQANVALILASVDMFRTEIATAEATARQTAAEAVASQATADRSRADLKRAEDLIQNKTISPQEFDTAKANAAWAEANLKAAQGKAASDESKVGQTKAQLEAGIKGYERAQAQTAQSEWEVKQAELNLSYARVTAPQAGYVTKKAVQPGDYVQVGQKLLAIVPEQLFVTANFKETQLQHIRPGQPVKVSIDAVAGGPLPGRVDSIMAGSGARFSLLPPENAVGNFVKVVQRVPVKIVFDKPLASSHVLGPGMSVVPSVRVREDAVSETVLIIAAVVLALVISGLWFRAAGKVNEVNGSQ